MSADAPLMLNTQLLADLERRWNAHGAAVARLVRPGLSDNEMDALTEPLGIKLPREARRWWGWHDGADPPAEDTRPAELGPRRWFLSLADAVQDCVWRQDVERQAWGGALGPEWRPGFLPIDGAGMPALLDTGVGFEEPVPVRAFVTDNPAAATPGVPSIGELVRLWIDAIDVGAWSFDQDRELWMPDVEKYRRFEAFDLL